MIPPPLLRRIRLTVIALLACIAGLVMTTLSDGAGLADGGRAGGAGEDAGEFRRPPPIPFADVDPWGANFFLEREAERFKERLTVEHAQAAGLRWARQHVPWSEVEPERGDFAFQKYDRLVDLYREHGLEVIMRLDWAPRWAVGSDHRLGMNNLPDDMDDFTRFVETVVRHFAGRVRHYQIWNEPNLSVEWGGRPADASAYVDMLEAASAAARRADPNAVIHAAPLAINTETLELDGNESDLIYLEKIYAAGGADFFDILSANAFGMDRPPDDPPSQDVLNFRRVELQRRIMESNGDGSKPIWIGEYGWNASPPDLDAVLHWQRVDEADQARYTVEGVQLADARWPWAGVFNVWYFRQEGRIGPERSDYYFRMLSVDFTPQRLFEAVRTDSMSRRVASPGIWEERSSPVIVESLDDWTWETVEGARDGNALIAKRTAEDAGGGSALELRFRGTELSVRAERGPQAGTIRVAIDGGPSRSLTLTDAERAWSLEPVAFDLSDGEHIARIEPGTAGGRVAIDHFEVGSRPLIGVELGWPAALAAGMAALSILLVVDVRTALRRATM